MLEVTLLDGLRVKEIVLLVISFLIREVHNRYIMMDEKFIVKEYLNQYWYEFGSILGLLTTGVISDLVLVRKRFLLLLIMNCCLFCFDVVLMSTKRDDFIDTKDRNESISISIFLGFFITGNDLLYLILIPMTVARKMQLTVNEVTTMRICFAGTIVGLVLAICLAGKFLISQNLATILYLLTKNPSVAW